MPNGTLLRRPGQPQNNQPQTPASLESLVSSVSDADRGMIRGKVLITADERSNKLIVITSEANMKFFNKVIDELDVTTTPEVEVKVVRLKYADAEDVADMINDLIGNSSAAKNSQRGNQNQNARNGNNGNLTLLTKEECAKAEDMGNFYRVPADNRDLNYDKYFKEGDDKRVNIEEFNSNNTRQLDVAETREKIASLEYIQNELSGSGNFVQ